MDDLRAQLAKCLRGRACVVGVGNPELGDDGLGVRLAERVREAFSLEAGGGPRIVLAGREPERHLVWLVENDLDYVLFTDAVDFGGAPGAAAWFDARAMESRCPQASTHKVSLGLLARLIEAHSRARAFLLGVQPACVRPGRGLSGAVQGTLDLLVALMAPGGASEVAASSRRRAGARGREVVPC